MPLFRFRLWSSLLIGFLALHTEANLTTSLNSLINNERKSEKIGVYVQNIETGSTLYAYNSNSFMTPASTTKVFTAAAAYLFLGSNYHYVTTLSTNGHLGKTLNGNVYLRFSGDPTLTSTNLYGLVNQIKQKGVSKINGNVILDQSVFSGSYYGLGWGASDFSSCEGAPIAGAIINSNCSSNGVVKNPTLYAQQTLRVAFAKAHISVQGKIIAGTSPAKTILIASHSSQPLQNILGYMLKKSDDVYANAIFKTIGKNYYHTGTYKEGARATTMILSSNFGKNFKAPTLNDGSGLSTLNRISPAQLVALYRNMYHEPGLTMPFIKSLAISGQAGTLIHRLTDPLLRGNVYAKTGTFHEDNGGASALAGYLILPKHAPIVFAIIINNTGYNTSHAQILQDKILRTIANYEIT